MQETGQINQVLLPERLVEAELMQKRLPFYLGEGGIDKSRRRIPWHQAEEEEDDAGDDPENHQHHQQAAQQVAHRRLLLSGRTVHRFLHARRVMQAVIDDLIAGIGEYLPGKRQVLPDRVVSGSCQNLRAGEIIELAGTANPS